jgi:hypothetical protein
MAHGVEPLFPFDLAEAIYLALELGSMVSMEAYSAEKYYASEEIWRFATSMQAGSESKMGLSQTARKIIKGSYS